MAYYRVRGSKRGQNVEDLEAWISPKCDFETKLRVKRQSMVNEKAGGRKGKRRAKGLQDKNTQESSRQLTPSSDMHTTHIDSPSAIRIPPKGVFSTLFQHHISKIPTVLKVRRV